MDIVKQRKLSVCLSEMLCALIQLGALEDAGRARSGEYLEFKINVYLSTCCELLTSYEWWLIQKKKIKLECEESIRLECK